ncbi:hypothetical protein [Microbulbifer sp. S227A]|uniref:hypothetical protein n=1 Tax=Microbulbifer sp. S227A TaxID=3415131 RepID=UPI003C7CC0E0
MSKPYIRVAIWICDDGSFAVTGYRRAAFHPEGSFATIADALECALKLPVKDARHPVNIVRGDAQ